MDFIARKSGGTAFEQGDLATPQVNIAYGSWYLRCLLARYDGSEPLALAAYNAGHGTVDGWLADAAASGRGFKVADIPYPETRAYVAKVLDARADYRHEYARELGLRLAGDVAAPQQSRIARLAHPSSARATSRNAACAGSHGAAWP